MTSPNRTQRVPVLSWDKGAGARCRIEPLAGFDAVAGLLIANSNTGPNPPVRMETGKTYTVVGRYWQDTVIPNPSSNSLQARRIYSIQPSQPASPRAPNAPGSTVVRAHFTP